MWKKLRTKKKSKSEISFENKVEIGNVEIVEIGNVEMSPRLRQHVPDTNIQMEYFSKPWIL